MNSASLAWGSDGSSLLDLSSAADNTSLCAGDKKMPEDLALSARPFLMLTLRRTGGTSLMSFMSRISPYPTVQHEPFNVDRIWGDITERVKNGGDIREIRNLVMAKLNSKPNVKHCFEIAPLQLNKLIIDCSRFLNYHIILLTRRSESSRQMSLALAQATGAWGPAAAAEIYPRILSGEVVPVLPDHRSIRARIDFDAAMLGKILSMLRHQKIGYDWALFEEVYLDDGLIGRRAIEFARKIGVEIDEKNEHIGLLSPERSQKSIEIARHIKGFDRFARLIKSECPD